MSEAIPHRNRSIALVLWAGLLFAGCGGSQTADNQQTKKEDKPKQPAAPAFEPDPTNAPIVGRPAESGYLDGKARLQIGPDAALRELRSPGEGHQFLLVRIPLTETGTLAASDYRVEVDGTPYPPVAVGFGQPGGVFASLADFVGDQVELVFGNSDQPMHDGRRILKAELKNPQVVLLYDLPWSNDPILRHGKERIHLKPDLASLEAHLENSVTSIANKPAVVPVMEKTDNAVTVEVLKAERARVEFVGRKTEAMVVDVRVDAVEDTELKLDRQALGLRGGDGSKERSREMYFAFDEVPTRPLARAVLIEGERHQDRSVVGLETGAIAIDLRKGESAEFSLFFLQPPTTGNLSLRFPGVGSVSVASVDDPIGRFPAPEVRMPESVVRAPLVGTAMAAGFLTGNPSIGKNLRNPQEGSPTGPDGGRKFLVLRFQVSASGIFVPGEYAIYGNDFIRYKPRAIAWGDPPFNFVTGLEFEELTIELGDETAPLLAQGKVKGFKLGSPWVNVLYEVEPQEEPYVFVHGSTQFAIEDPQPLP